MPLAEAVKGYPIELDAVVTYSDPEWGHLFVQDRSGVSFIDVTGSKTVFPIGTHIRVLAVTSKNPNGVAIVHPKIQILSRIRFPAPLPQTVAQVDAGGSESHFVVVEGILRPCSAPSTRLCYRLFDGSKRNGVSVRKSEDVQAAHRLIGALVRVKGVVGRYVNAANQRLGMQIFVNSLKEIEVITPAPQEAAPPTPAADILSSNIEERFAHLVHIRGVVTWTSPALFSVQDATGTLFVNSVSNPIVHMGDRVDVAGFPGAGEFGPELADSQVSVNPAPSSAAPTAPLRLSVAEAMKSSHNGKRVQIAAHLVAQSESATAYVYQLADDQQTFSAIYLHPAAASALVRLPGGSSLEVTGIAINQNAGQGKSRSLLLLIDSPSDIVVHRELAWLTLRWAMVILALMVLAAILPLIWVRQLRFKVHQQTAILRTQFEKELRLENRFRRLFEHNMAAVYFWKPDGAITECNAAFVKLLGFERREQVIGRSYWEFETNPAQQTYLKKLLLGEGLSNHEATLRRDDGAILHLLANITPVQTPEGTVYETTAIDVTQLRHHQDELQRARDAAVHESLKDPLTGLSNRRHIMDTLAFHLASARQEDHMIALLYLDLDGFKVVNDSLGHGAGDELLVQVAHRLRARIRETDMVARIGGDEFMIVMNHIFSPDQASTLAASLLSTIAKPFEVKGNLLSIGVSIGISIFPSDANDAEELMQRADGAMYAAKRGGKNNFMHFNSEIVSQVHERLTLENLLRGAIARDEITVHYQPEFDLATHRLTRFEALARWTHPTLGEIPPGKFIPIAEENGLIDALGAYVMEQACTEALRWQQTAAHPIQLAVNVSSIQFRNPAFADEVAAILARTGLSPQLFQIEVTESAMLEGEQDAQSTLASLRTLGIGLAIDDFGTGYSNLSYLPSLAFDLLKIDRSFVRYLETQPETEAMIRTMITLAKSMGMRVIVEGVETDEQLRLVRECGADEVQGFHTGRPVADPIAAFLTPMTTKGKLH